MALNIGSILALLRLDTSGFTKGASQAADATRKVSADLDKMSKSAKDAQAAVDKAFAGSKRDASGRLRDSGGKFISQARQDAVAGGGSAADPDPGGAGKKKLGFLDQGWKDVRNSAMSAAAAYVSVAAAQKGFDLARQSAMMQDSVKVFESMGYSIQDFRDATKDMISDQQLVQKFGLAQQMGISADEFKKLAMIADAAAKKTGQSQEHMFESIMVGTARSSRLILDNLGIMVDWDKAHLIHAKTLKKTVKEMTEQEKKQSEVNFVLAQGADMIRDVQAAGATTSDVFDQFDAAASNLAGSIGSLLLPAARELGPIMQDLAGWMKEFLGVEEKQNPLERAKETAALLFDEANKAQKKINSLSFNGQGMSEADRAEKIAKLAKGMEYLREKAQAILGTGKKETEELGKRKKTTEEIARDSEKIAKAHAASAEKLADMNNATRVADAGELGGKLLSIKIEADKSFKEIMKGMNAADAFTVADDLIASQASQAAQLLNTTETMTEFDRVLDRVRATLGDAVADKSLQKATGRAEIDTGMIERLGLVNGLKTAFDGPFLKPITFGLADQLKVDMHEQIVDGMSGIDEAAEKALKSNLVFDTRSLGQHIADQFGAGSNTALDAGSVIDNLLKGNVDLGEMGKLLGNALAPGVGGAIGEAVGGAVQQIADTISALVVQLGDGLATMAGIISDIVVSKLGEKAQGTLGGFTQGAAFVGAAGSTAAAAAGLAIIFAALGAAAVAASLPLVSLATTVLLLLSPLVALVGFIVALNVAIVSLVVSLLVALSPLIAVVALIMGALLLLVGVIVTVVLSPIIILAAALLALTAVVLIIVMLPLIALGAAVMIVVGAFFLMIAAIGVAVGWLVALLQIGTMTESFKRFSLALEWGARGIIAAVEPLFAALMPLAGIALVMMETFAVMSGVFLALLDNLGFFEALFEAIKLASIMLLQFSYTMLTGVEYLLKVFSFLARAVGLGDLADQIDATDDAVDEWQTTLGDSIATLTAMTYESARARAVEAAASEELAQSMEKATSGTLNLPEAFKLAAARGNAINGEGGGGGLGGGGNAGGVINFRDRIQLVVVINGVEVDEIAERLDESGRFESLINTGLPLKNPRRKNMSPVPKN